MIPERRRDSNKGTFGKVLVIAGAKNMAGAAYLSALAAYRTGAGLVKVFTPEENRLVIQTKLPEAILSTYDPKQAEEDPEEFSELIKEQTGWADVIVLGPGIGREEYTKTLVETVLSDAYVPIIMDADAVNLAAENEYLKGYFTENIILTPHVLEMSRLSGKTVGEIKENLVKAAWEFSERYGVTCVIKDAATVTARRDGKIFVNRSGTPAMAKGGSGDVLTGVIAGFIAIGMEECDAASLGVYVHGLAGEKAEAAAGTHSVLAGELADHLMEVINGTL
jgi:NAD(P)H-hydrate epimerase